MLFQKSYWQNVTNEIDVIRIIHDVKLAIRESKVQEGMLTVYVPDGMSAVILAPDGLDKEREFMRWLKDWSEPKPKVREEQPNRLYLSYLFGASCTIPIEKGEMIINVHSTIYLVDFTDSETRREFRISIFSETPPKKGPARRGCG
jgi:thiamine phosphate synthase YjbQ (UPF0047 family)